MKKLIQKLPKDIQGKIVSWITHPDEITRLFLYVNPEVIYNNIDHIEAPRTYDVECYFMEMLKKFKKLKKFKVWIPMQVAAISNFFSEIDKKYLASISRFYLKTYDHETFLDIFKTNKNRLIANYSVWYMDEDVVYGCDGIQIIGGRMYTRRLYHNKQNSKLAEYMTNKNVNNITNTNQLVATISSLPDLDWCFSTEADLFPYFEAITNMPIKTSRICVCQNDEPTSIHFTLQGACLFVLDTPSNFEKYENLFKSKYAHGEIYYIYNPNIIDTIENIDSYVIHSNIPVKMSPKIEELFLITGKSEILNNLKFYQKGYLTIKSLIYILLRILADENIEISDLINLTGHPILIKYLMEDDDSSILHLDAIDFERYYQELKTDLLIDFDFPIIWSKTLREEQEIYNLIGSSPHFDNVMSYLY